MKTLFKIVYYVVIGVIALAGLLLVISFLPVTGNYKVMMVLSGSMEPDIKIGSLVIVKPALDYKIGEVITFKKKTDLDPTTHRIEEIRVAGGEMLYTTKGDANNASDRSEASKSDIIGKVLFDIPYLGYVINFIQKPFGFLLMIIIPAFIIIGDEVKKIYNEVKKKKNESN
jgi:signal peptidase